MLNELRPPSFCRLEGVKFEHAVLGLLLASRTLYGPKVDPHHRQITHARSATHQPMRT